MTHDHVLLPHHVRVFQLLRDGIAAANGLLPDDEFVLDTASGECGLDEAIVRIVRESRARAAYAKGMSILIAEMQERKAGLEASSERLKTAALHAMSDAGLKKINAADFAVYRQATQPSVQITDEAAVPLSMRRPGDPSKTKIREAIEAGQAVPFAYISQGGETIVVRGGK